MLGELLVARELISRAQLDSLLAEELATGKPLSQLVLSQGLASGPEVMEALIDQLSVEVLDATPEPQAKPDLARLDIELAQDEPLPAWVGFPEQARDTDLEPDEASQPVADDSDTLNAELMEIRRALRDLADLLTSIQEESNRSSRQRPIGFA